MKPEEMQNTGHKTAGHSAHETTDVRSGPLFWMAAGCAVLVVLTFIAMAWLFSYLDDRASQADRAVPPDFGTEELTSEPRLQVDPPQDLEDLRQEESNLLNGYGWVDRDEGIVRVPIQRAMELLLERGLPSSAGGEAGSPDRSSRKAAEEAR